MFDFTQILNASAVGDATAAGQLLPLVYDELRRLAAQKLAQEKPGHTLQATALVHEAYLRLVEGIATKDESARWANRRHFFAAAAEAMRRILVESARRKAAIKHGGLARRVPFDENLPVSDESPHDLLDLEDALTELEGHDKATVELVKLRYFAGLSHQEAAEMLGITRRAADRLWSLGRAWLQQRLEETRE
jgi:RNA polymerase sigma factor (TIGR02999 family)